MGKIVVPEWDSYFMTLAYLIAMRSKDERTHVGAVVVGPDREIRATGYNSFVRGLNDNVPERQQKPEKFFWFEHGERNAIYNSTLSGVSLKACKMYTNGIPCMDCARAVVQSGITEVIYDKEWQENAGQKWKDNAHRTSIMFNEVGVGLRAWTGNFTDIIKFSHCEILPLKKK